MDKKVLILNSALELFVKQDVDKTSTASIAKNAGVSNGTLFHYFPTKNELIIELYLRLKKEMFEFIYSEQVNNEKNLKNKIKKGWTNAVEWICTNSKKHNYIHKIYKSNYNQLIHEDRLPDMYLQYLNMIDEAIKKKELIEIPLELMVSLINAQVSSLAEYYIKSNIENKAQLTDSVFQMTWNSIKYK